MSTSWIRSLANLGALIEDQDNIYHLSANVSPCASFDDNFLLWDAWQRTVLPTSKKLARRLSFANRLHWSYPRNGEGVEPLPVVGVLTPTENRAINAN